MNVTVRSTTDDASIEYRITGEVTDSGDGGGGIPEDPDTSEHTVEISGGSPDNEQHYEIRVDGEIEPGENANTTKEDDVTDGVATGYTVGGADDYRYVGEITYFDVGEDATVLIDGTEVDPDALAEADAEAESSGTEEWTIEDSTDNARQHQFEGEIRDFEQTGGDSDWVLEVNGMPTAFGGPESPPGGEFGYATRAQVKSFVECSLDAVELDLGDYVHRDDLSDYPTTTEMQNVIQSAFENASVSLSTSGLELNPPEE